jgi:hypothetical protein
MCRPLQWKAFTKSLNRLELRLSGTEYRYIQFAKVVRKTLMLKPFFEAPERSRESLPLRQAPSQTQIPNKNLATVRFRLKSTALSSRADCIGDRPLRQPHLGRWLCRMADRTGSARVRRSYDCPGRGASAPDTEILCNDVRTHRSLNKDTPVSRPVLGGLRHRYGRIGVSITQGIGRPS